MYKQIATNTIGITTKFPISKIPFGLNDYGVNILSKKNSCKSLIPIRWPIKQFRKMLNHINTMSKSDNLTIHVSKESIRQIRNRFYDKSVTKCNLSKRLLYGACFQHHTMNSLISHSNPYFD